MTFMKYVYMAGEQLTSVLPDVLTGCEPDLLISEFVPPMSEYVVVDYRSKTENGSLFLYKEEKLTLKKGSDFSALGYFPGLNLGQLFCPTIEIYNPKSTTCARRLSAVAWSSEMLTGVVDKAGMAMSVIAFVQRLAMFRQEPVFIGGDLQVGADVVSQILQRSNENCTNQFIDGIKDDFADEGFLPSMTYGSTRSVRHQFQLRLHKANDTHFFCASKELEFSAPSLLPVGGALGKQIQMEVPKIAVPCRPPQTTPSTAYGGNCGYGYQTNMGVRQPPPRHHGG